MVDQKTAEKELDQETTGMTSVGLAFVKAGGDVKNYDGTPEALANARARSFMRAIQQGRKKGGTVTPEELEAQRREHLQRVAQQREEDAKNRQVAVVQEGADTLVVISFLRENPDDARAILNDLQIRALYGKRSNLLEREKDALEGARQRLEDPEFGFDIWHDGEKALLLEGDPEAQSPELRQGFTAWFAERKAKRQAERQESRDAENVRRQALSAMATADFHKAYNDHSAEMHLVYVDGHYPAMQYDEGQKKLVPVTRPEKGDDGAIHQVPVTRRGTFLLTVTITDGVRYGQILDGAVNMPMIKVVPYPDNPVPLYPAKDFRTDRNKGSVVAAMLAALWKREEQEIAEKEKEATDTTVYDLLAGTEGRAMGESYFSINDRAGYVKIWWHRSGGMVRMTKYQCRPSRRYQDQGKKPFDFSTFPKEGISVDEQKGDTGFIKLARAILVKMSERHRALDKYEVIKASDTVKSMAEALGTGKGVYTFFHDNWREGSRETGYKFSPVVLQVKNTGRGNVEVVDSFITEPALDVPVRTKVPTTLDLQMPDEFQGRLERILKFAAGIRTVAANNGANNAVEEAGDPPAEPSNADEKVVVESDA